MRRTLSHLEDRRDLGVRGCEKPGDLLGQRLVGGKSRQLVLPQVEIAPGEPVEVGRIVLFRSHRHSIADCRRPRCAASRDAKRSLSHCGIGAKVPAP
ncbi:MAG: hypothetical protein U1E23_11800 [Reyranellaceae bacterium]